MNENGNSLVSVVVPCYNEEAVLETFFERVGAVARAHSGYAFEFVFVDDGSDDGTAGTLDDLAGKDARVKGLTLSRNFGHQIAITAGLDAAAGQYVVVIDADLQDPPELIPDMLERLENGNDIVHMVRHNRRGESLPKRLTARLFYAVMRRCALPELPLDAGDFKAFNRRVLLAVRQYRERVRFIRGIFAGVGFKQTELSYARDPRYAGRSKYPWRKVVRFAVDAVTAYSLLPLRLALVAGVLAWVGLVAYLAATLIRWVAARAAPDLRWTAIVVVFLGLSGLNLIFLGMIGEYLGRVLRELKQRPLYVVRSRRNLDDDPQPP